MSIALKTGIPLIMMLGAVAGPLNARSLQVSGTTGYLSEWQVTGNVTETVSGRTREYLGPLTMKHIGLCSQNGPEEKTAEIKLQITRPVLLSQSRATVRIDGTECSFGGKVSDDNGAVRYSGVMDCPHVNGVPFSLSIK